MGPPKIGRHRKVPADFYFFPLPSSLFLFTSTARDGCSPPPGLACRRAGFMQAHPLPPPMLSLCKRGQPTGMGGGDKSIISFQRGPDGPLCEPPLLWQACYIEEGSINWRVIKGGRCVPVARVQRPTEPAGETATPPPLELDYIKPSPSRTEKDEIIALYPYGRG